MLEKVRTDPCKCSSPMVHLRPAHPSPRLLGSRIAHHCNCSLFDRAINVTIAVGALALHGKKQIAWFYFARVVLNASDLGFAGAGLEFDSAQDLRKSHGRL